MSDDSFELLMPFLPVTSRGGPFDDAAYAAGWEAARIDAHLTNKPSAAQALLTVANIEQADLIAMRNGYVMTIDEKIDGWATAKFEPEPGS